MSWEQYEPNTAMLSQNGNRKGSLREGGVRGGASVFAGLLRCGACGRKVRVNYSGAQARSIRSSCSTHCRHDDGKRCLAFSAKPLERRWNEALQRVTRLAEEFRAVAVEQALSAEEREMLRELGADWAWVWNDPGSWSELKKRIARMLVKEIVLFDEQRSIRAVVHWPGGVPTEVKVRGFPCARRARRRLWTPWRSFAVWPDSSPTGGSRKC